MWQRYRREINPQVSKILLGKKLNDGIPAAGNPLWLTLALEQLNLLDADDFARADRTFEGTPEERLTAMVMDTAKRMPADMEDLYEWLINQNEKIHGREYTVSFSIAIALSSLGWRESDLLGIIPRIFSVLFPEFQHPQIDELKLAALRRGFRGPFNCICDKI